MIHSSSQVVKSIGRLFAFERMLEVNRSENIMQLLWGNLLFGITPCFVRIMVSFYHSAIQSEVDCSLGGFQDSVSSSIDMARVMDDFHAFPFVFYVDGH